MKVSVPNKDHSEYETKAGKSGAYKAALAKIQSPHQLLNLVIENIVQSVFWKDRTGRYLGCNMNFARELGFHNAEEIVGKRDEDLPWSERQAEYFHACENRVMEDNEAEINLIEPRLLENGEKRWYQVNRVPMVDDKGRVIGILGTYEDISSRRRAEKALAMAYTQLDQILNTTSHGMLVINRDFRVLRLNDKVVELLGIRRGHPGDRRCREIIENRLCETDECPLRQIQNGKKTVEFEVTLQARGEKSIPFILTASRLEGQDGELIGIVTNLMDISDRKAAEEELKRLNESLVRSNAELEQFAYAASHDLQEPLRKIQVFGERLGQKYAGSLDEKGLDYLKRMRNAASRLQSLINDLLQFSRVTRRAPDFNEVDLRNVVEEVISDLEVKIKESGARIEYSGLPVIEANRTQMKVLLQNLTGNALKFQKPGISPYVKITGRISEQEPPGCSAPGFGEFCIITVEDNGIGFDAQYAERIFTIFQRLHGRSEYNGSGIGLALCKKIVKYHGGGITAKSEPGQGALFEITLPVKQIKRKRVDE